MARKKARGHKKLVHLSNTDKILHKIYTNPQDSGSFGGFNRLWTRVRELGHKKISKEQIKKYLEKTDTYTLHRPHRLNYPRSKTIVSHIDKQWQADLIEFRDIASHNNGYKYVLAVIDCFSKYAWVVPIKNKDGVTVEKAFKHIFENAAPRIPERLQTDQGLEFYNSHVKGLLEKHSITLFSTYSDTKAAIVERFNRTIKTRIQHYFTAHNTRRYVDVLDDIVHAYNNSKHRTIGMKPIDVTKKDESSIFSRVYGSYLAQSSSKASRPIKINSTVRISRIKRDFEKGYTRNWSIEKYRVASAEPVFGRLLYRLRDETGEDIKGRFYSEELQPTEASGKNDYYQVERILQTRTNPKTKAKEYLVKFKGYHDNHNQWIGETNIKKI
jgi:transposase InsO family protein